MVGGCGGQPGTHMSIGTMLSRQAQAEHRMLMVLSPMFETHWCESRDQIGESRFRVNRNSAVCRFSPRIDEVTAQFTEVVGARGSSQPLCRLSVRMKQLGSFSVESLGDEVATAVSRAADRAAKQVQRILDRRRDEMRPD